MVLRVRRPFELKDNDSSFTHIHRRCGTSIPRLQSFLYISHVFADTLYSIYRANVSLGAQKQLTWVWQQVGILSADHLNCRILGGRGVAFTSSVVESVCDLTFPIRALLSSHHFDNDTTAQSFCTFVGVFTRRPSTMPLCLVLWPQ